MRIYNNISAMTAYRSLSKTDGAISKSMTKLSTGLRINSAADDAAGLTISEKMRNQIKGMNQAIRNSQDGQSMMQTAESAMSQQHEILQRVRELTLQSNNGTVTDSDKETIQNEISQLVTQINDIATQTQFNGKSLLKGTVGVKMSGGDSSLDDVAGVSGINVDGAAQDSTYTFSTSGNYAIMSGDNKLQKIDLGAVATAFSGGTISFDELGVSITTSGVDLSTLDATTIVTASSGDQTSFQVGAENGQTLAIAIGDMQTSSLGAGASTNVTSLSNVDVTTQSFTDNLAVIDQAISDVSTERSTMGAYMNRLDYAMNNLQTAAENTQASESRIRDLDMANEMLTFTRNNILSQASTAMLAQANQKPQAVLQLLG